MYSKMHREGYAQRTDDDPETYWLKPEDSFKGDHLLKFLQRIKRLTDKHGAKTILDYGAGKGEQYSETLIIRDEDTGTEFKGARDYWHVDVIDCYEPAFDSGAPGATYDGVISTDVLEHCYVADAPWIVEEMFACARSFVFVNVACYPAVARLPNGENAHITIRPPLWWHGLFEATANRFPDCDYELACVDDDGLTVFQRTDYEETVSESSVFTG